MADGNLVLRPEEAKQKASQMVKIAGEVEQLLNDVKAEMEKIDNEETGIYQGDNRPAQLRAQLDEISSLFHNTYDQIQKSADDIVKIANAMPEV